MNPPSTIVDRRPELAARASAKLRVERVRQRREMRHLSAQLVVQRLVNPTPELASFRLETLLAPYDPRERPISGFGRGKFANAIRLMHWAGHTWVDPMLRLGQLSLSQRRQLASAVLQAAPKSWSGRGR